MFDSLVKHIDLKILVLFLCISTYFHVEPALLCIRLLDSKSFLWKQITPIKQIKIWIFYKLTFFLKPKIMQIKYMTIVFKHLI